MKGKVRAAILATSEGKCIYCGGTEIADTIDHMPPIILFKGKQRPKGWEFPSCAACNKGASHSDLVAAMFGRAWPNLSPDEGDEMRGIFNAVRNNIPGLLEEMNPSPERRARMEAKLGMQPGDHGFLAMDGPIAMSYMRAFGARLAIAMHFNHTGQILPSTGGASVRIYSNVELFGGKLPQEILDLLPEPSTLIAGSNNMGDQFRTSTRVADGGQMTMTFATFRLSFGLMTWTAVERSKLTDPSYPAAAEPLRPGYLRKI